MNREWTGIDRLRLDKFYMVRRPRAPLRGPRVPAAAWGQGWGGTAQSDVASEPVLPWQVVPLKTEQGL